MRHENYNVQQNVKDVNQSNYANETMPRMIKLRT